MANKLIYTGRVAAAPVLTRPNGTPVCKFTLIRNEYAGKNEDGSERPERVVRIQFTAFRGIAEAIAQHALEGDQLEVEARLENNDFTDKDGVERWGYNHVVESFEFGAPGKLKRAQLEANRG